MPKFSLEKTINKKRDVVFGLFSDFENYEKKIPQHFPSVRVRSTRGDVSVVEEHLNLGTTELLIMAKHVISKPVSHDVFVIGGDVKGSHIQQQFIELSENQTKVIIQADFKVKGKMMLSNLFGKNDFKENYAVIINDIAKLAES